MSRDPFEELFGPLNDDNDVDAGASESDARTAPLPKQEQPPAASPTVPMPAARPAAAPAAATEPIVRRSNAQPIPGGQPFADAPAPQPAAAPRATQPMPARQRLAHEQAERVHNSQRPEKQPKTLGKALPWIIVAIIAIAAIVVAIVLVNGTGNKPAPTPEPQTNSADATSDGNTPEPEEPEAVIPPEPEKQEDEVPSVEVGATNTLPIEAWDATSELSARLGSASYSIPDNKNLELSSDLIASFPADCGYSDGAWGATKNDDGTYSVRRPAACDAAPGLYSEVWGLLAAWVDTIK